LTRWAVIRPIRARNIAAISPPTFYPLNTMNPNTTKRTGTVSETVSESSRQLRKILAS
jgi:hypothetical protein